MKCKHCNKPILPCSTYSFYKWKCTFKGYIHSVTGSHYCNPGEQAGPMAEPLNIPLDNPESVG